MVKIVRFHKLGSADVLQLNDLPLAEPAEGEVRLKVEAIGLNRAEDRCYWFGREWVSDWRSRQHDSCLNDAI